MTFNLQLMKSINLAAVEETGYAVGLAGLFFVVGHHHYGAAVFFVELVEEFHHFSTHF